MFWAYFFKIEFFPKNWHNIIGRSFFKAYNALPFVDLVGNTSLLVCLI